MERDFPYCGRTGVARGREERHLGQKLQESSKGDAEVFAISEDMAEAAKIDERKG